MPIAAVPNYLGSDLKSASPALCFGLLLPIWTTRSDQENEVHRRAQAKSAEGQKIADMLTRQGMEATIHELRNGKRNPLPGLWDKNDFAARTAWARVKALTSLDKDRMNALVHRQQAFSQGKSNLLSLNATATAPFTTGLGNEHPLENGFAFLNPYGLPYLPGSSVKGVLRQAAQELASGQWGDAKGWSEGHHYRINVGTQRNPRLLDLSLLDVLFGRETPSGDSDHVRGALTFWDVIPQIKGESLMVEIMTPHQSHYYQQKKEKKSGDSVTPHDSGQPTPICFLTVPPGSTFTFYVVCDTVHLRRLTQERIGDSPDLAVQISGQTYWHTLLSAAFEHAFKWLGFGAKTAVGYGALRSSAVATADPLQTPVTRPEAGTPSSAQSKEERWSHVTLTYQKGGGDVVKVEGQAGKAEARGDQAQTVLKSLSPEQAKRLEKKGSLTSLTVVVVIEGNKRTVKTVVQENSTS